MIDADAKAGPVTRGSATVTCGGTLRPARIASVYSVPIMHGSMASPRIWRVGAPVHSVVGHGPSIGATDDFPRVGAPVAFGVATHAVLVSSRKAHNVCVGKAHELTATSVTFRGGRAGKDAASRYGDRRSRNGVKLDGTVLRPELPQLTTWDQNPAPAVWNCGQRVA